MYLNYFVPLSLNLLTLSPSLSYAFKSFFLSRTLQSFLFPLSLTLSRSISSFLSSSLFLHFLSHFSSVVFYVNLSSGFHPLANNSFSLFLFLPFLLSPSVLENYYQEFTIGFEVEKLLLQTFSIPLALTQLKNNFA